tara:strand:+ start:429 stop:800 length:372 start_codon:yes stop_codon:yes gene_type:complete
MLNDVSAMKLTTTDYKSIALPAELQGLLFSCLIFSSKGQINQCKKSQVSSQSVDCSRSNVTGCRPFVTDLSVIESLIRSHLKRDFKAIFNFIKTIKKLMEWKNESNQFYENSFRKIKAYTRNL